MLEKLESIKNRFEDVSQLITDPGVIADQNRYMKLTKEYKELEELVNKYEEYRQVLSGITESREIIEKEKDEDFKAMAKEELDQLNPRKKTIEEELKVLLIPKDPNDDKNVILEIRAGTGGDESAIFAGDLFRMYQRFADQQNWKISISDFNEGDAGGYSKIVAEVSGAGAYGKLKFESGVHRVQRVPQTESQGRVHTSAASVAVLPEVDDVEINLDMHDVRVDRFCSSGPGGQSVNTTYSAVRLTHEPTGLVVQCQDQKSQLKNLEKAKKELMTRILAIEMEKQQKEIGDQRKSMVGSGDRSDKIRTYNYPQGRVTDHRINKTVYNLPAIVDGDLGEFIEELQLAENAEKMKEGAEFSS
jgi:peptide chain release factor 1